MLRFNVRVYGILMTDQREVLLCDEKIQGRSYTKFPGGGLEYGEGPIDCVAREFLEEADLKISVDRHLYTTEFFQESAFQKDQQIISIYYLVKASLPLIDRNGKTISETLHDHFSRSSIEPDIESFRLIPLEELKEEMLTLPIDKVAVRKLIAHFNQRRE